MSSSLPFARTLFELGYRLDRYRDGGRPAPIQRRREEVTPSRRAAYERLRFQALERGGRSPVDHPLPWPKVEFLNYLCDACGYVAHGSTRRDLDTLQPVRRSTDSTEFGRRDLVFATPDAVWAMWFAILDKDDSVPTRNGCTRFGSASGSWTKYYHFDLPRRLSQSPPFTDGMIYLARPEDFTERHEMRWLQRLGAEFEEWGSPAPVDPVMRVPVGPEDFPYLDRVEFTLETG